MTEQQKQAVSSAALHLRHHRRIYREAWRASVKANDAVRLAARELELAEDKYKSVCDEAVSIDAF